MADATQAAPVAPRGVEIEAAHIQGSLDLGHGLLRQGFGIGKSTFDGPVSLRDGHFERTVRFDGSTFAAGLMADGASFDGSLLLDGVTVTSAGISLNRVELKGSLWADGATISGPVAAVGLVIGGGLFASNATFRADVADLSDVRIGGHAFFHKATFDKGLYLYASRIGGKLVMSGATFNGPVVLRDLQVGNNAELGGVFEAGIQAAGMVTGGYLSGANAVVRGKRADFSVARIGGGAIFSGAELATGVSLNASTIDGNLIMAGATSKGLVDLSGLRVGKAVELGSVFDKGIKAGGIYEAGLQATGLVVVGFLSASNAVFKGSAANFSTATIGGGVSLNRAEFHNGLSLNGSNIAASLIMTGATSKGSVDLRSLRVGQSVELGSQYEWGFGSSQHAWGFRIGGNYDAGIQATGLVVGGYLDASNVVVKGGIADFSVATIGSGAVFSQSKLNEGISLNASRIGGNLIIRGAASKGPVDLQGLKVGNGVELDGVYGAGIQASGLVVTGYLDLAGVQVTSGEAKFDQSRIGGAANFNDAVFGAGLSLNTPGVGGSLNMNGSTFKGPVDLISLDVEQSFGLKSRFEGGLTAFYLAVAGNADASDATFIGGDVDISGAKIGGGFAFRRAVIGRGLSFNSSKVGGNLILTDIGFGGLLDLRGTSVGNAVELGNSRLYGGMNASYATVSGYFDAAKAEFNVEPATLDHIKVGANLVFTGAQVQAGLSANSATVGGSMFGRDMVVLGEFDVRSMSTGKALDLTGSRFEGSVLAGGISVNDSADASGVAFNGGTPEFNQARIAGGFGIQDSSFSKGLNLNSATIGGNLNVYGMVVSTESDWRGLRVGQTLNMDQSRFEDRLMAFDMVVGGTFSAAGAQLPRKSLDLDRSRFQGTMLLDRARLGRGLSGHDMTIAGPLLARGLEANSGSDRESAAIDLGGTVIGGELSLVCWEKACSKIDRLDALGLTVGGSVNAGQIATTGSIDFTSAKIAGGFNFSNARVGQSMQLDKASISGNVDLRSMIAGSATSLGQVRIGATVIMDDSVFVGLVMAEHAQIGGFLTARRTTFLDAVCLSHAEIGASLYFAGAHVAKGLQADHLRVGGDFDLLDKADQIPEIDRSTPTRIAAGGIDLGGARIAADVRLGLSQLNGDLKLADMSAGGTIDLSDILVVGSLFGGGLVAGADVILSGEVAGSVLFYAARIRGDLNATSLTLTTNLIGDGTHVEGSVLVQKVIGPYSEPVQGVIRMEAMHVGRDISMSDISTVAGLGASLLQVAGDATFDNIRLKDDQLYIRSARIGGDLRIANSIFGKGIVGRNMQVNGDLDVTEASIEYGGLSMEGAKVDGDATIRGGEKSSTLMIGALSMRRLQVSGSLTIEGLMACGQPDDALDLADASIGRDLVIKESRIYFPLRAYGIKAGGSVKLSANMFAAPATLSYAAIEGDFALPHSESVGLDLSFAAIKRNLDLTGYPKWSEQSKLNLSNTKVGTVKDHGRLDQSWPKHLMLDSFIWDGPSQKESETFYNDWLKRDSTFLMQTYLQAAGVFRAAGLVDQANETLYEARNRESEASGTGWAILLNIWKYMANYSIGPWMLAKVLGWVVAFTVAGAVLLMRHPSAKQRGLGWCLFASLDRLAPLVGLGPSYKDFFEKDQEFEVNSALHGWFAFQAIVGYFLLFFLVAGLAQFIQTK